MFKWLLEKSLDQIKIFGIIIQDIITGFYGDMRQIPNQQMCMTNLMISEIFRMGKVVEAKIEDKNEFLYSENSNNFENILRYPGIFDQN